MPDEGMWNAFYDADCLIEKLGCTETGWETIVEFGSGYGTFTLPAARRTAGQVITFDIEPELTKQVQLKANEAGLTNVKAKVRDFVSQGTGLVDECADHVMLYNILHIEQPLSLLYEAFRVLRPGGKLSIIHWRRDIETPRGPAMEIRPSPEQCRKWAEDTGFLSLHDVDLSACCSYHYGLVLLRPATAA